MTIENPNALFCIPDAPVCTATTVLIAGASLEESISVPCRIIADPSDVTFEWTFSSSGERFEVPHGHYTTIQQQQHHQLDFPGLDGQSSIIETNEQHVESDGIYKRKFLNGMVEYLFRFNLKAKMW